MLTFLAYQTGGLPVVFRDLRPGNNILGGAWHLDAFSAYLFRTWLRSDAPDGTTATPEVRLTRSSRTKVRTPQVSFAHSG